jgi:uncharacterized protein YciI
MLVLLTCRDKPNATELRQATRSTHLAYVQGAAKIIKIAGPLLSEDGERMAGSFFVLEVDSLAAAREFSAKDPYAKAGLFASVTVDRWRWTFENGAPRPE